MPQCPRLAPQYPRQVPQYLRLVPQSQGPKTNDQRPKTRIHEVRETVNYTSPVSRTSWILVFGLWLFCIVYCLFREMVRFRGTARSTAAVGPLPDPSPTLVAGSRSRCGEWSIHLFLYISVLKFARPLAIGVLDLVFVHCLWSFYIVYCSFSRMEHPRRPPRKIVFSRPLPDPSLTPP